MRWLALVAVFALLACESRVIVTRTASPQLQPTATASGATLPSASTAPPKIALRPIPSVTPPSRLLSSEQSSDIPVPPLLRFLLTDDGRVITQDSGGQLFQRKLTPTGAATMVLQAIQTGLFDKDASYPRVPIPGTTPPARGPVFLILVVANAGREVRVSFEPTGQPDDEQYQKSTTREKLTALARRYEDLSSVPANQWADSGPAQPYQPAFQRVFILADPNLAPMPPPGTQGDADAIWPFLTPIDALGAPMTGTLWRCAVVLGDDARILTEALTHNGRRNGPSVTAALAWRTSGSVRLAVTPLMPHEPATCAGAAPPLF